MTRAAAIIVDGSPYGPQRGIREGTWRSKVADAAAGQPTASGLILEFVLAPGRWVDLDTLTETAVAGLRDAGMYARGLAGLDAVLATKRFGQHPGLRVWPTTRERIASRPPPGPVLLEVAHDQPVHAGATAAKRRWRDAIAASWTHARVLDCPVWADVEVGTARSLLGPLEPVLDALEPCLGRDPRGQPRQEFFPNDDLITWLRVRRGRSDGTPAIALRLGPSSPSTPHSRV